MFERFVADLLTRYLGEYIKTLNTENLKIGIWSGNVSLENLELKKNALEKFNLPFTIKEGFLGKLSLKIPWNNLKTEPVIVVIDNLYITAVPKSSNLWDEGDEEIKFQKKLKKLKVYEAMKEERRRKNGNTSTTTTATNTASSGGVSRTSQEESRSHYNQANKDNLNEWSNCERDEIDLDQIDFIHSHNRNSGSSSGSPVSSGSGGGDQQSPNILDNSNDQNNDDDNDLDDNDLDDQDGIGNENDIDGNNNNNNNNSNSNNSNSNDDQNISRASFAESLRNKIVDNLQILIYNVHIRFEDTETNPSQPFCFGVTLEHLLAQSTNEEWRPSFIHTHHTLVHKLITLQNLSVYWDTHSQAMDYLKDYSKINQFKDLMTSLIFSNSNNSGNNNNNNKDPLHSYLLHPVCGSLKLLINKSILPNKHIPSFTFNFEFDEINFELESKQYQGIMALVDWFSLLKKGEKYRKYKPKGGIKSVAQRWRFAIDCVLGDIRDKMTRLRPSYFDKRRKDRLEYIYYYKLKKRKKQLTEAHQIKLENLEREYCFEDIVYFRSLAEAQIKSEDLSLVISNSNSNSLTTGSIKDGIGSPMPLSPNRVDNQQQQEQQQQQQIQQQQPKKSSWFGWFGWGGGNSKKEQEEDNYYDQDDYDHEKETILKTLELSESQKREFYSTIEYDEHHNQKSIVYPKDYVKTRINFIMNRGSIAFRLKPFDISVNENKKTVADMVIELVHMSVKVDKYPESLHSHTILETICVRDYFTENTHFPILMKPLIKSGPEGSYDHSNPTPPSGAVVLTSYGSNTSLSSLDNDNVPSLIDDDNTSNASSDYEDPIGERQPLFEMIFQQNPLTSDADFSVFIEALPLEVIYNKSLMDSIMNFFGNAPSDTLKEIEEAARNQIKIFKDKTTLRIQYELQNHKTVDLDININAPHVLIPESFVTHSSPILVLDLGSFSLLSINKSILDSLSNQSIDDNNSFRDLNDYENSNIEINNNSDIKNTSSLFSNVTSPSYLSATAATVGEGSQMLYDDEHLYDLFQLQLKNIQFYIVSKGQSFPLVNKFDINFRIYKCIIKSQTLLSKLKLFGDLPSLNILLSQSSIEMLIKIFSTLTDDDLPEISDHHMLKDSGSQSNSDINIQTSSSSVKTTASSSSASNIPLEEELVTEQQQQQTPHSVNFTGFEETTNTGVPGLTLIDSMELAQDQDQLPILMIFHTILEVNFSVPTVSLVLIENGEPFVKLFLSDIGARVNKRTFDMSIQLSLKKLYIEDLSQEFKNTSLQYFTTSAIDNSGSGQGNSTTSSTTSPSHSPTETMDDSNINININSPSVSSMSTTSFEEDHLIKMSISTTQKNSPQYTGISQQIDISFNSLLVNFNKRLVLKIIDLVQFLENTIRETIIKNQENSSNSKSNGNISLTKSTASTTGTGRLRVDIDNPKIILTTKMKSLIVNINEDDESYVAFSIENLSLNLDIDMESSLMRFKLGNLSISDISKDSCPDLNPLFGTDGEHIIEFYVLSYKDQDNSNSSSGNSGNGTGNNNATDQQPKKKRKEFDTKIGARMSSIKLIVVRDLIDRLIDYFEDFGLKKMDEIISESAKGAVDLMNTRQQKKVLFEVDVDAPRIIFPKSHVSPYVIIADLGHISVFNNFTSTQDSPSPTEQVFIYASSINFHSCKFRKGVVLDDTIEQISNKINLFINIETIFDISTLAHDIPKQKVVGEMSPIAFKITDQQYTLIISIIKSLIEPNIKKKKRKIRTHRKLEHQTKLENLYTSFINASKKQPSSEDLVSSSVVDGTSNSNGSNLPSPPPPTPAATATKNDKQKVGDGVHINDEVSFRLPHISVEFFRKKDSVVQFELDELEFSIVEYANGSDYTTLSLNSIDLTDTRKSSNNHFRKLIYHQAQPLSKKKELTLYIYEKRNGDTELTVILDSFRVIIVPESLVAMIDFIMPGVMALSALSDVSPIHSPIMVSASTDPALVNQVPGGPNLGSSEATKSPLKAMFQNKKTSMGPITIVHIETTNLELSLVDNPTRFDSKLLVLKASAMGKINVQEGDPLTYTDIQFGLDKLELFKCRADIPDQTEETIISPHSITITVSMVEGKESLPIDILIGMDPVHISFSYQDFLLFVSISKNIENLVTSLSKLNLKKPPKRLSEKTMVDHDDEDGGGSGNDAASNSGTGAVKKGGIPRVNFQSPCISLTIINDHNGKYCGIADIKLSNVSVEVIETRVFLAMFFSANYFNISKSIWEPAVEKWGFKVGIETKDPTTNVIISSNEKLNLNITKSLFDLVNFSYETFLSVLKDSGSNGIGGAYYKDTGSVEDTASVANNIAQLQLYKAQNFHPFILRNHCGLEIRYFVTPPRNEGGAGSNDGGGGDYPQRVLVNGGEVFLDFKDLLGVQGGVGSTTGIDGKSSSILSKVRDITTVSLYRISFIVDGFEPVLNLPIHRAGIYVCSLVPKDPTNTSHRVKQLVYEITVSDSSKLLSVRSNILLVNETDHTLEYLDLPPSSNYQKPYEIQPKQSKPLPIHKDMRILPVLSFRPKQKEQSQQQQQRWSNPLDCRNSCLLPGCFLFDTPPNLYYCVQIDTHYSTNPDITESDLFEYSTSSSNRNNSGNNNIDSTNTSNINTNIKRTNHIIKILPPLVIQNHLSLKMDVSLYDQESAKIVGNVTLDKYESKGIYSTNTEKTVMIRVRIEGFSWTNHIQINNSTQNYINNQTKKVTDQQGNPFYLNIFQTETLGSIKVNLYFTYWISNDTGLNILYKLKGSDSTTNAPTINSSSSKNSNNNNNNSLSSSFSPATTSILSPPIMSPQLQSTMSPSLLPMSPSIAGSNGGIQMPPAPIQQQESVDYYKDPRNWYNNPSCQNQQTSFMFSPVPSNTEKNIPQIVIQVDKSQWSNPILLQLDKQEDVSIVKEQYSMRLSLQFTLSTKLYDQYSLTRHITISPKYMLINNLPFKIFYSQINSAVYRNFFIEPKESLPFHFMDETSPKQINFKLAKDSEWSGSFGVNKSMSFHIKLEKGGIVYNDSSSGSDDDDDEEETQEQQQDKDVVTKASPVDDDLYLALVQILVEKGVHFITLNPESKQYPPYKIENLTSVPIKIHQIDTATSTIVEPGKYIRFVWTDPMGTKRLGVSIPNTPFKKTVSLDKLQFHKPTPLKVIHGGTKDLNIRLEILAHGPTNILRLVDLNNSNAVKKNIDLLLNNQDLNSSLLTTATNNSNNQNDNLSSSSTSSTPNLTTTTTTSNTGIGSEKENSIINLQVLLSGISLSLIDGHPKELIYLTLAGLEFNFSQQSTEQNINFSIENFKVDNQLYHTPYPVIVSSGNNNNSSNSDDDDDDDNRSSTTTTTTTTDDSNNLLKSNNNCLNVSFTRSTKYSSSENDIPTGIDYIKELSFELLPLEVQIDETLLFHLYTYFNELKIFKTIKKSVDERTNQERKKIIAPYANIPVPLTIDSKRLYFEFLYLPLIDIVLSYRSSRHSSAMIGAFAALANIDKAPLHLESLKLEHQFVTAEGLGFSLLSHYKWQFSKILLYSIFGAPISLAESISRGVNDFFYEYAAGFTNPEYFTRGVAKGTKSLVKNSIYGIFNSANKLTTTIGSAIAPLSLDSKYLQQREHSERSNQPRHVIDGVSSGIEKFSKGIAHGIAGLVDTPIREFQDQGLSGLFRGFGKGILGTLVKPTVGAIDMISSTSQGIQNFYLDTALSSTSNKTRTRPPRYIGPDGIIRSYSFDKSFWQEIIKDMPKHESSNKEWYVTHFKVYNERNVYSYIVITTQFFYVLDENFTPSAQIRLWDLKLSLKDNDRFLYASDSKKQQKRNPLRDSTGDEISNASTDDIEGNDVFVELLDQNGNNISSTLFPTIQNIICEIKLDQTYLFSDSSTSKNINPNRRSNITLNNNNNNNDNNNNNNDNDKNIKKNNNTDKS
ncbi:hypothetical protein CYY_006031 [Polysphondylium violaceum]|uniref:Vacuolar protein sorting-associated protein 13 family protein n=1 Tax=Polysphondylium violaceum TaxID=133409 RepID=A0A8J4PSJ7_9MYCE|nr:hypothetical protein CYY_006031 [Polysphondylium violaceum]